MGLPLERPRHRLKDDIKVELNDIGFEGLD
jgi:hypothetical protein